MRQRFVLGGEYIQIWHISYEDLCFVNCHPNLNSNFEPLTHSTPVPGAPFRVIVQADCSNLMRAHNTRPPPQLGGEQI